MTDQLKRLLDKWEIQTHLFKIASEHYRVEVNALALLNDQINKQLTREGLTPKDVGRA
jgi:hypothetical protein